MFPKFVSSDSELNVTYEYRCELFQRHIKKTPTGHIISEFLPDVPWAGKYNSISCPGMHHFREGRWLQDTSVMEDYAVFWCTEGNPRLYSFPLADSVMALSMVTGDFRTPKALYPKLAAIHRAWDDHRCDNGMYTQLCDRDGMEYSISGDGLRPTINSYMYAENVALSQLANWAGDREKAHAYEEDAKFLRDKINDRLWNENIGMYGVVSDEGLQQNVREQVGYIPWIYGIPVAGRDDCFRFLLDPACFQSPHGLRTADASHPAYMKHFDHECLWNGPVWPFATAQTLTAVIEYLNANEETAITAEDFMSMLLTYAYSHRDTDGTPWLDENMHPDTGVWLAREILRKLNRKDKERGQHYNHSTFIDLVMTGVCGIRPAQDNRLVIRPLGTSLEHFAVSDVHYHGHILGIVWDKADGLRVTVDETREYTCKASDDVRIEIEL